MRQIISAHSVKAIYLDRKLLLEKLRIVSLEAAEKFTQIKEIILFGSLAKNEETGLSDVDLFLLVDKGEENPLERLKPYFNFFADRLDIAVDLIVALDNELEAHREMLKSSIILYNRQQAKNQ